MVQKEKAPGVSQFFFHIYTHTNLAQYEDSSAKDENSRKEMAERDELEESVKQIQKDLKNLDKAASRNKEEAVRFIFSQHFSTRDFLRYICDRLNLDVNYDRLKWKNSVPKLRKPRSVTSNLRLTWKRLKKTSRRQRPSPSKSSYFSVLFPTTQNSFVFTRDKLFGVEYFDFFFGFLRELLGNKLPEALRRSKSLVKKSRKRDLTLMLLKKKKHQSLRLKNKLV